MFDNLFIKALLAGALFGTWPLLMNRSGLSGNVSSACFALGAFLVVLPFAWNGLRDIPQNTSWLLVITAFVLGGLGLLEFNGMLAKATPRNIGAYLVVVFVVQISVSALYQVIITSSLPITKAAGFAAAVLAAVLLLKK